MFRLFNFFTPLLILTVFITSPIFSQENNDNTINTHLINTPYPELHPIQLQSNWWSNFNGTDKEIVDSNISKLRDNLKILKEFFKENSVNEEALTSIDNIEYNISSYLTLYAKALPISDSINIVKQKYNIDDFLALAQKTFNFKKKFDPLQNELNLKINNTKILSQNIDNITVKYINIEEASQEKLMLGLKLIEGQFQLGTLERKIVLMQKQQEIDSDLIASLTEELSFAAKNLQIQAEDLASLENQIKTKTETITSLDKNISRLELELLNLSSQNDLQRSKKILAREQIIKSLVNKEILHSHLIVLKIRQNITLLHQNKTGINISELQNEYKIWNEEFNKTKKNINDFQQRTLQQQIQSTEIYSRMINSNIEVLKIENINSQHLEEINQILSQISLLECEHYKTTLLLQIYENQLNKKISWLEKLVNNIKYSFSITFNTVQKWSHFSLFKIGDRPVTLAVIFKVIITLIISNLISKYIIKIIYQVSKNRRGISEANIFILKVIVHYLILSIGILVALNIMGLTSNNLAIIIGALSVGIGFGLQSIVNNFLCGLIILFERNLKIGDYIQLESGEWGKITSVNMQNTLIETIDGTELIVPNSEMITRKTTNWTMFNRYKRIHIPFSVAYGSDKDLVQKACLEAALRVPVTVSNSPLYDDPSAWLISFGENGLNFELVAWVNVYGSGNHGSFTSSYSWELETSLKKYNLIVPFNQLDLHFKSDKTNHRKTFIKKGFLR